SEDQNHRRHTRCSLFWLELAIAETKPGSLALRLLLFKDIHTNSVEVQHELTTNAASYFGEIWLSRWLFQRGLAAIYVIAFVSALNQFRPLLGERGLLPVPRFLAAVPFRCAPSI